MSVIGKQIKKYRIEKGITQEQLGEMIGVTTQAVSRWERGGTPDAELLPDIASILDVTIDALFGREEQSYAVSLARKLCRMGNDEAYRYAFDICWAIEFGLLHDPNALDDFLDRFIENKVEVDRFDYFCKLVKDAGITTLRLSRDLRYFFMMVEPKGSLKDQLAPPEKLRNIFKVFADERMLRIIYYMYSRLNTPLSSSLISKNTGIDVKEVDRLMIILCKNNLATHTSIADVNGEINSYMFSQESSVIPLLCYADEIGKKYFEEYRDFICTFERTKPLLK